MDSSQKSLDVFPERSIMGGMNEISLNLVLLYDNPGRTAFDQEIGERIERCGVRAQREL
jgi:hypothetical protein